ncbi:MAG: hypothetical protein IT521_04695 [Burkholderiales bacterium]|nr:hypothetical protein [Burkholderiales bacterium]
MVSLLLTQDLRVKPGFPIEITAQVDAHAIRVAIEWSVIEHEAGPGADADAAHRYLHDQRSRIERAIQAHLFAQGMPLRGQLTLSRDDLETLAGDAG